jgi:hypothetical protein
LTAFSERCNFGSERDSLLGDRSQHANSQAGARDQRHCCRARSGYERDAQSNALLQDQLPAIEAVAERAGKYRPHSRVA